MTRSTVVASRTEVRPRIPGTSDGFDLDVSLVEIADSAGLVNLTDANTCGSTCGACTTNVA
ncbi:FxLD family lantipeptide OS=Streptomyces microflavus OX=1919 GN=Smic_64480 PE=4 SV=1 [Streptomyces microflavus]